MVIDYTKLGVKAGLEIHQQLDVGGKLFCRCPAFLRNDGPDFLVRRKLHAVAGETGEVDMAVQYEANLKKDFIYQGYNDTTCLIEVDEEPPKMIDERALDEVLKIALLLNCEIYPATQIMRKTVIDGSNTSGFQRTLLIGHDGFLEMNFGKVGIAMVAVEEDSARLIGDKKGKEVVFRLDRLGIPLVEISTKAQLYNAEQIKDCALKLGEILRVCKVRRGIGTIRQDLNVSIKGHDRVEIKGFQDPRIMIKTVELEVQRQIDDLKNKRKNGEVRNSKEDGTTEFLRPMPGGARMYPETDLPLLKINRDRINAVKKNLPKLKHEIRDELKKIGLNDELMKLILDNSNNLDEFETLIKVYNKDANLVAKMVVLWRQEFATRLKKSFEELKEILSERILEKVLERVAEGKLSEGDVKNVLWEVAGGKDIEKALKIDKVGDDALEGEIIKIVKEKPGLGANAYMGMIIGKMGKNIDKRKAMEILNRIVNK
ncbi:MAG: Glu-tRNA(Gln) amidotransferase subunit GatE [Nanoarchaeota archaeon]|nr:Glu-tRNA(Gln) amidotransferase subunit GatE [Nanoarchaeota archaeon]